MTKNDALDKLYLLRNNAANCKQWVKACKRDLTALEGHYLWMAYTAIQNLGESLSDETEMSELRDRIGENSDGGIGLANERNQE